MFEKFKRNLLKSLMPFTVIASIIAISFIHVSVASTPLVLKAGQILDDRVNIYSSAYYESEVLVSLSKGTYITLRSNNINGWYNVSYGDNEVGYVSANYIKEIPYEIKTVKVDTIVRTGPSESYRAVGLLGKDEIFLAIGRELNGWYRVLFNGIDICYISNENVDFVSETNMTSMQSINTTDHTHENITNYTSAIQENTTTRPIENITNAITNSIENISNAITNPIENITNNTTNPIENVTNSLVENVTNTDNLQLYPNTISTSISYDTKVGNFVRLPVALSPSEVTDKTLTWKSDNEEIASIRNDGSIFAEAVGTTRVTVTTANGLSSSCIFRVMNDDTPSLTVAEKAVRRAYDYLTLFGAYTENPAILNGGMLKVHLDSPYIDGKRYTDSAQFVWFCYRSADIYLEDKTDDVVSVETMSQNPGKDFERLNSLKKEDLKPGDIITWMDYYAKDNGHAAMYVGNIGDSYYVIDISPQGIQRRTIDDVNRGSSASEPTYYILRCTK